MDAHALTLLLSMTCSVCWGYCCMLKACDQRLSQQCHSEVVRNSAKYRVPCPCIVVGTTKLWGT